MNDTLDTTTEGLIDEITRYLAAVDVFRAEGREPTWRPELFSEVMRSAVAASPRLLPSDVGLH